MTIITTDLETGLTSAEVLKRQTEYGKNQISAKRQVTLLGEIIHSLKEPMFILLLAAAGAYLMLGESLDSLIMFASILAVLGIHIWQSFRTDKSLEALKKLAAFTVTVIRDSQEKIIPSEDLVPGDVIFISEGLKIPADCVVFSGNDLKVNEATLTGEPDGVWKIALPENGQLQSDEAYSQHYCYAGTFALQGSATAVVQKIGADTKYGQIGQHLTEITNRATPLQLQIKQLLRVSAIFALVCFLLVTVMTFINLPELDLTRRLVESAMSGLAIAIAMIPEEFPVVLTVFLSMGAWRMAKQQTLIRNIASVETLGAVSILAVDKTGTLTYNQMTVDEAWSPIADNLTVAGWLGLACETKAYDPMEQAMLDFCKDQGLSEEQIFSGQQVADWPFDNRLKMMGQAWQIGNQINIAAKGSADNVLKLCQLDDKLRADIKQQLDSSAKLGKRVIALATATIPTSQTLPEKITDLKLSFLALIILTDPPRAEVKAEIAKCQAAGVRVVMITGDSGLTASSIAEQVGIANTNQFLTGADIDRLPEEELAEAVKKINIFARVTPNHKLKLIKAFQTDGFVTAMTGDGVNDAPALRQADIGIAMSQRGSDVAREASDLILLDDNFSTIVHAIADGRRIYANIKKSVEYIIAVHMPIALSALLAPLLQIKPADLLILPVFVVILELIIDPTCSIVLERGKLPAGAMKKPPRSKDEPLINWRELGSSIIQGLTIFVGAFGIYYYLFATTQNSNLARSAGLAVIVLGNLYLAQIIATDQPTIANIARRFMRDRLNIIMAAIVVLALGIMIYSPINSSLKLDALTPSLTLIVVFITILTTFGVNLISRLLVKPKN